jgi:hypothetical protein
MSKNYNLWPIGSCTALVIVGLVLTGDRAGAQTTAQRPWSVGVSAQQQKHAEALYAEGNQDLNNGLLAAAVAKYQAALLHWNHPGIHYNLALALISLDRPIEAYENILRALSQGMDALSPEEHQRAIDYERMLRRRIATVEVVCDEPGAVVTLDGKPLFTGPGWITTRVLPGEHQLVASKVGYLTMSKAFTLAGAARTRVELRLPTVDQPSMHIQQRWPAWTHWTVTGLGLGAGAAAFMLHWELHNEHVWERDGWQRKAGYAGFPTAGALLVSGTLLASLNHPQPGETEGRWPAWAHWTVTGLGLGTGTLAAMLVWDFNVDLRVRERDGEWWTNGRQYGWKRTAGYAGYATAGALLIAGTVLASLNRPRSLKTGEHPKAVQLSPGGPAGSPGISVHISF